MAAIQQDGERAKLLETARELYARLVTAQRAHRKQLETWHRLALLLRWLNVLLALLTTAAIVSAALVQLTWVLLAAVALSFITSGVLVAQVGFDPARRELEHQRAAGKLAAERGRFLVSIQKIASATMGLDEAQVLVESLTREDALMYSFLREPGQRAYRRAAAEIKRGEGTELSHDEIDRLLPQALRMGPVDSQGIFTMHGREHGGAQQGGPTEVKPGTDS